MQLEPVEFTKNDLAKYPFLKETAGYIKPLDLQIEDLTSIGMDQILKRAEERVCEAINFAKITRNQKRIDLEISSYPAALLLVAATENSFIRKRYALAEAKQASEDLTGEPKEKVLRVAENFGWKLTLPSKQSCKTPSEFVLHFSDYLRNTTHLRDKKWKLINRILIDGSIYLNKNDVARLLEEEIQKHIERRLESAKLAKYPPQIVAIAERIKKLAIERIGPAEMEGFPKIVVQEAFPPCIKSLYEAASSSRHLSHVGRFTLTSFLVNIGMPPEKVNELFKNFSDYNERLTRYQIEHIAGERGSGTRYTPPQCATLQTHGVCVNSDDLCSSVRHPLSYYRRRQRRLNK
ncbi:DNA primase large subunit PriL [Candidatus Bathyarchaeota archaeon]|nr:DNA primase large subunit PriL [Candidatus Bathyarchaeota archaeon]